MSIVLTSPVAQVAASRRLHSGTLTHGMMLSAVLTPLALLILGYHPYAEDGGLYLAGVKYLLNPSLFPHQNEFVTAPLQYSVFAPCLALIVRHTGLSFAATIFASFLITLWATIFSAWLLARQCFRGQTEQAGATVLVALWLSLPVAGTSLMLIDPYLTARSFSTPCVLLAISSALCAHLAREAGDRSGARTAVYRSFGFLAVAAAFHPLMAGYGAAFVITLFWLHFDVLHSRLIEIATLLLSAIVLSALVQRFAPAEPSVFSRVALTRTYWYLAQWRWFEIVGLFAPMLLLAFAARSRYARISRPLITTTLTLSSAAILISLLFARKGLAPSGVAHLQPLRVFQTVYFVLLVVLGAHLGGFVLRRRMWTWAAAIVLLGMPVLIPSWFTFPHSHHLELPFESAKPSPNKWVNAFRWIQGNTPQDALFALDADYITADDEDAQSFRAIAERSVLPDYSKDGGETAVNPRLSESWARGVDAQQSLSRETDPIRLAALKPLGVTWLVLRSSTQTDLACTYDNGAVKVCRMP